MYISIDQLNDEQKTAALGSESSDSSDSKSTDESQASSGYVPIDQLDTDEKKLVLNPPAPAPKTIGKGIPPLFPKTDKPIVSLDVSKPADQSTTESATASTDNNQEPVAVNNGLPAGFNINKQPTIEPALTAEGGAKISQAPKQQDLLSSIVNVVKNGFDKTGSYTAPFSDSVNQKKADQTVANKTLSDYVNNQNYLSVGKELGVDKLVTPKIPSGADETTAQNYRDQATISAVKANWDILSKEYPDLSEFKPVSGDDVSKNFQTIAKQEGLFQGKTDAEHIQDAIKVLSIAGAGALALTGVGALADIGIGSGLIGGEAGLAGTVYGTAQAASGIGTLSDLVGGTAVFGALHAATNPIFKKLQNSTTISDTEKSYIQLARVLGETLAAGGVTKYAPDFLDFLAHDTVTRYSLPKVAYLDGTKMRDIFQTGKLTTEQEKDMVKSLGLDGNGYKNAFKNGVSIAIPSEKIISTADRPWWAKVKSAFGFDSSETEQSRIPTGKPEQTVRGYLNAPKQTSFDQIADLNKIISDPNVSQQTHNQAISDLTKVHQAQRQYIEQNKKPAVSVNVGNYSGDISVVPFLNGTYSSTAELSDDSGNGFAVTATRTYPTQDAAISAAKDQISKWAGQENAGLPQYTPKIDETKPVLTENQQKTPKKVNVFRGSKLNQAPMIGSDLGAGKYFAENEKVAREYGDTIEKSELNSDDFKDIDFREYRNLVQDEYMKIRDNDPEWDGTREAAIKITDKARAVVNDKIQKEGYKGITSIIAGERIYNLFPEQKSVQVSSTQGRKTAAMNPVGEGKIKTSAMYERVKDQLGDLADEKDFEYNEAENASQAKKAVDFIEEHPQRAQRIADGRELPPEGILKNAIMIALKENLMSAGKFDEANDVIQSLRRQSTRYGQEIQILKHTDPNSFEAFLNRAADARTEAIAKRLVYEYKTKGKTVAPEKAVRFAVDEGMAEIKRAISKNAIKVDRAIELLNKLTC